MIVFDLKVYDKRRAVSNLSLKFETLAMFVIEQIMHCVVTGGEYAGGCLRLR